MDGYATCRWNCGRFGKVIRSKATHESFSVKPVTEAHRFSDKLSESYRSLTCCSDEQEVQHMKEREGKKREILQQ